MSKPTYLILTLSIGQKRLVPIAKIFAHASKTLNLPLSEIEAQFDTETTIAWTANMKWSDAFQCHCHGGMRLNWDYEWKNGNKEIR